MTTAQMRPVARMEKEANSILRVEGLEVGVRLMHPYLLTPLQLYIHEAQTSEFASDLLLAGRISRQPDDGPGFVKIYYNRLEVPLKDWAARDRGDDPPVQIRTIPLARPQPQSSWKFAARLTKNRPDGSSGS
jgi:hypothetical protein